jgi:hypothetical protein
VPSSSLSLRERSLPISATVGTSLAFDLTAPGWTWVLGDTDAFVFSAGAQIEQVFAKSAAGTTLSLSLSAAQTSALGPGAHVWALRVGTQYWLGGRLDLDLPGEDLDPEAYDGSVTIAVAPTTITISLPAQAPPSGVTTHASTHATGGGDAITIGESQVTNLVSDLAAKQPLDSDLTAIAALAPADDALMQRKAGAWTSRTPAQVKADLALVALDVTDFDEAVRDRMGLTLVQGSGMTITVNDVANTITLASSGSGGTVTDEQIEDVAAALISAGYGVTKIYSDLGAGLASLEIVAGEVSISSTPPPHKDGRLWFDPAADPYEPPA